MKSKLVLACRILVLTILYLVCFSVVFAIVIPRQQGVSDAEQAVVFPALLSLSFLNTLSLVYVISRSRWTGWKLVLSLCFVIFGVTTVMPQIETAVFVSLPGGLLPRLFLAGFLFSVIFSPLTVLILGKRRSSNAPNDGGVQLPQSINEWTGN